MIFNGTATKTSGTATSNRTNERMCVDDEVGNSE